MSRAVMFDRVCGKNIGDMALFGTDIEYWRSDSQNIVELAGVDNTDEWIAHYYDVNVRSR